MRVPVHDVGAVGIVKDIPGYALPPNVWTDGQNVRMLDGSVFAANGWQRLFTAPIVDPYFVHSVQTPSTLYWLYAGLSSVHAIQNKYHFTLRDDLNANTYFPWTADSIGGVLVMNNGVDMPMYWPYPTSHGNELLDLPGWDAGDRCRVMRSFKNYLVAINVNDFTSMVKWSHGAEPGLPPMSWDITDPTLDAGQELLPQAGGPLLDELVLRDTNILYRSNATWGMQFIGPPLIFRFFSIFETSGILNTHCAREFFGKHFVVTTDDIVVHDGQQVQSVANDIVRRAFFNELSSTGYDRAFVVHNIQDKEMWVCYPEEGETYANKAWVWSYADNNWANRNLPGVYHAAFGGVDEDAQDTWDVALGYWDAQTATWSTITGAWDSGSATWDGDDKPWNYRDYDARDADIVAAVPADQDLMVMDEGELEDTATLAWSITRTGLALTPNGKTDLYSHKQVRAVYPQMEGTGTVSISVGFQQALDESVTWTTAQKYVIGRDYKTDHQVDGRLISLKFEGTRPARLHGYQLDIEGSGDN